MSLICLTLSKKTDNIVLWVSVIVTETRFFMTKSFSARFIMGSACEYIKTMNAVVPATLPESKMPWLSQYGDMRKNLEYCQGSIYDMLNEAIQKYPNYTAMEYFNTTYTFSDIGKKIGVVAKALKKLGIVENESVTVCMPNIPEAIFLIYAINKIGAICNVIHPLNSTEEIENALATTTSSTLFVTDASYSRVKDIKVENLVVCEISNSMNIVLKTAYNIKSRKNLKYNSNAIRWSDFLNGVKGSEPAVKRDKNDPAVIIYSGGTTGKSKAIALSNLCFNALATQCYEVCPEARAGNSILSALPIFHGFGLCVSVHVPLTLGLKCIIIPKIDVKKLNETIRKKKPNLLPAIPTMLKAMTNNPFEGPKSLESVKVILSGGDYLSNDVRDTVLDYFKKCGSDAHIQIGYGLSEATAFFTATKSDSTETDNLGIPNPDTLVKVCNPETNEELPDGEIGEICVNGPTVMLGYINEKEETDNVIRTHEDGIQWLHTGDLGYFENGVLHFTSRLKRMIISNGYNIYPTELENVINKCKYVASSVVVGIKDKIRQEAPKAVIVLKNGVQRTAEVEKEIKEFCKKNIAKNAQPSEFEYTDTLPTTKIGKINYRKFERKKDKEQPKETVAADKE